MRTQSIIFCFNGIFRAKHGHIRKRAHERDVFDALVRLAVTEIGEAGARTANADRQVWNANRIAKLVVVSTGCEQRQRNG